MLVFGHVGLTLGAAVALAGVMEARRKGDTPRRSWFGALAEFMDIRLLMVGSLLPDIIDKPVGLFLFRDFFSDGRIFSHTLLFLILLAAPGIWLYRRSRRTWLLALAFGTLTHLVFDQIWLAPRTFFFPLYGWGFDKIVVDHWISHMIVGLFNNTFVWASELAGLVILLWFGGWLLTRKSIMPFVKSGRLATFQSPAADQPHTHR
ncbi:MAG: metal-dependent hydrolase [Chloroflexi bacterium]|nr:metal-dependent hydrolase [Chloroflexota bacterium]